jgi:hypothetical protein
MHASWKPRGPILLQPIFEVITDRSAVGSGGVEAVDLSRNPSFFCTREKCAIGGSMAGQIPMAIIAMPSQVTGPSMNKPPTTSPRPATDRPPTFDPIDRWRCGVPIQTQLPRRCPSDREPALRLGCFRGDAIVTPRSLLTTGLYRLQQSEGIKALHRSGSGDGPGAHCEAGGTCHVHEQDRSAR